MKNLKISTETHSLLKQYAAMKNAKLNWIADRILENQALSEMAMGRSDFVDRLRDAHLQGALGEYAKLVISEYLGEGDFWSKEIKSILKNVEFMLSIEQKTKARWSKKKAFAEALKEAEQAQFQIKDAKKELLRDYPKRYKKHREAMLRLNLDAKQLMSDMLKQFYDVKTHKVK